MGAGSPGQFLIDLLYPRRCPVCHEVAPYGEKICPDCRRKLPVIRTRRCALCSKPVEDFEELCGDCRRMKHLYTEGFAAFLYNEDMRTTISWYKYKGRREYGEILGELLYQAARPSLERWRCDLILPVPLHKSRLKERGYNQAGLMAREIARLSGIPMREDLLARRGSTLAMKNLGAEQRQANLSKAFSCGVLPPEAGRILLVDDIYTTGATIDACAGELLRAGADRVYFLTLCIGSGFLRQY